MFGWFKNSKQKAIDEALKQFKETETTRFQEYLRHQEEEKRKAADAEARRLQELEEVAKKLEKEREDEIKSSEKPWVKVESADVDNNGNIAIKLDWNPAFINYLRLQCNFEGDEEKIIHQWLAALYREMVTDNRNTALDILKHFPDTLGLNKTEPK
jgi:hypothetical protein